MCLSTQYCAKDSDCDNDEVDGQSPKAKTINDHRRELPFLRLLVIKVVGVHFAGDAPQFGQDGGQLWAQGLHPGAVVGSRRARRDWNGQDLVVVRTATDERRGGAAAVRDRNRRDGPAVAQRVAVGGRYQSCPANVGGNVEKRTTGCDR